MVAEGGFEGWREDGWGKDGGGRGEDRAQGLRRLLW